MVTKMKKKKHDKEEKKLEEQIQEYVPASGEKRKKVESILEKNRKTRNINIRIREYDLERLREKAAREGIPYQTLVSQIIHKYVNDRLHDEKDIIKSIELLRKAGTESTEV